MKIVPRPSPVTLSIDDKTGRIRPAMVTIDTENDPNLVVNNPTNANITILLPHGVSGEGSIFGVEKNGSISIPVTGSAPHRVEIPYWVFFSHIEETDEPKIHDWGQAASPPTMILYP
jgi:hypothetical protein